LRRFAAGAAVLCFAVFSATGCFNAEKAEPQSAVFEKAPWTGPEELTYALTRRGEKPGSCVLQTKPAANGPTVLNRLCGKDEFRDDGSVTVDAATLAPSVSTRTVSDAVKGKRTTYTTTIDPPVARFQSDADGDVHTTTRDLPVASDKVANPRWYDDESVLWLVRGLKLEPGARTSFTLVINAGQPSVHTVEVRVEAEERVKVAAGEFQVVKVRLTRGGSINFYWVEAGGTHRLIRATIEDVTYELTSTG
jgi:hypothetical protein